ncbi:MAG: CaiB/BaiF CoA transferase family protein [Hyphomonadaceae bacterium]
MAGAFEGIRIVELAGLGPAPFAGMMLADHGAEVIRIERPGAEAPPSDVLARSRRSVTINLKDPAGVAQARALARTADGLIEGFRPNVMERLGLGPDVLLADNPRLVYGRMTGWGQSGPYAAMAGHDINYIALSGVLDAIGRPGGKPTPPLNLVGDFGGGGMLLAFGMAAGLLQARITGRGQVIDCAMVDGAALLSSMIWGARAQGKWSDVRGENSVAGGAHYYDSYETADGQYISIASSEPQFYAELRRKLGLEEDAAFDAQLDRAAWPALKAKIAARFLTRTRAEWCALLEGSDVCFAPVLTMQEAPSHRHNAQRETFVEIGGVMQPAPAPRFSETPAARPRPSAGAGAETEAILRELR